jgi:hypothetical protein
MPQKPASVWILQCYHGAAEARTIAETTADPATRAAFLEIERHWLLLARSFHQPAPDSGVGKPRHRKQPTGN